jgi:hypothetical protein
VLPPGFNLTVARLAAFQEGMSREAWDEKRRVCNNLPKNV